MSMYRRGRRTSIWVASLVFGAAAIGVAYFVDDPWGQGLLVNAGTALLLFAPLFAMTQLLAEKVDVLDVEVRGRVRGLAALKEVLPSGPRRTTLIDAFLTAAREPEAAARVSDAEFAQLCRGDEFERTVALATSLGNSMLFDGDLVVRSILKSDSANEQYYALLVADGRWHDLDTARRNTIVDCLQGDERAGRRIRNSRSRSALADQILERATAIRAC